MAQPSLEDVKSIDQNTKYTIYGFIRNMQKQISRDNIYYTIPELVIHWILLYFYIADQFDPEYCSNSYQLSANNCTITKLNQDDSTAFLTKVVSKGVHKWKFILHKKVSYGNIIIGVWKSKYTKSTQQVVRGADARGRYYGYYVSHRSLTNGDKSLRNLQYADVDGKDGDIIEMILDLNSFKLEYNKNGKSLGIAFDNISRCDYVVCIEIVKEPNSIELLSYNCVLR